MVRDSLHNRLLTRKKPVGDTFDFHLPFNASMNNLTQFQRVHTGPSYPPKKAIVQVLSRLLSVAPGGEKPCLPSGTPRALLSSCLSTDVMKGFAGIKCLDARYQELRLLL